MLAALIALGAGVLFVLLLMAVGLWPETHFRFRRLGWFAAWAVVRRRRR